MLLIPHYGTRFTFLDFRGVIVRICQLVTNDIIGMPMSVASIFYLVKCLLESRFKNSITHAIAT